MPEFRQPKPGWQVTLDGTDLTPALAPRLVSLSLTEKRGEEADELEIVVKDTDGALALPPPTAIIRAQFGWAVAPPGITAGLIDKGSFRVDEIGWAGPPDLVTITARSADLTAGLRRRRDRSWVATTIGAVVNRIARDHGLTARVHPSLAGIAVRAAQQTARSDLQFVRDLGRRHDAVATVKDGRLLFMPIGTRASAGGTPLPAVQLTRALCETYDWRRLKRDEHDGAEAQWHDRDAGERRTVREGGAGNPRRLRRTYASEQEAREAAAAARRRDQRQKAEFTASLAYGNAALFPECPVTLSGFKAEIDAARWQVAEATHKIEPGSGFRTDLTLDLGAD